jgi:hypothetical protein
LYLNEVFNNFVDLLNTCLKKRIERTEAGTSLEQSMDEVRSDLRTGLDRILPDMKAQVAACKHEGFWEEREWRLTVALPSDDRRVFHTSGRFGITPRVYFELRGPDGLLPIKRIVVGPCPHMAEALESLKGMLTRKGYSKVQVCASQIPYRNW